jgi:hypothetical protein
MCTYATPSSPFQFFSKNTSISLCKNGDGEIAGGGGGRMGTNRDLPQIQGYDPWPFSGTED